MEFDFTKTFNGKSEQELKGLPIKVFVRWEELVAAIENVVKLRGDELLEGIIVQDNGLHACISRKRGRKEREAEADDLFVKQ